jgi:RNA polymerase sigma-70 factor (ECF subfamily)
MSEDRNAVIMEDHRGYLMAIARLQLASRPWVDSRMDASDLVQQTLLKAHAAREDFRGQSEPELAAWLRQILNRTLANELRALGQEKRNLFRERSLEDQLEQSSQRLDGWLATDLTSPSRQLQRAENVTALAAAVDQLSADQRHVILARHCHGQSLAEISTELNRTPAAVAGLLRRGLASLREILAEGSQ